METKLINQVNEAIPAVVKSTAGILPTIKDLLIPLIPLVTYSPVLIIPVIIVIYRAKILEAFRYIIRQDPMPLEAPKASEVSRQAGFEASEVVRQIQLHIDEVMRQSKIKTIDLVYCVKADVFDSFAPLKRRFDTQAEAQDAVDLVRSKVDWMIQGTQFKVAEVLREAGFDAAKRARRAQLDVLEVARQEEFNAVKAALWNQHFGVGVTITRIGVIAVIIYTYNRK